MQRQRYAINKIRSIFSKSSSPAFQILSDLHLEAGQQYSSFKIPPSAPFLILAGDIGRLIDYDAYAAFLAKQTAQFERVFWVLGNHEFYGLSEDWTIDCHNESHKCDITWLKDQVTKIQQQNESIENGESKRNILVVTHHAPSIQETSSPKNVGNAWSSAFATDLIHEGNWPNVKTWVFGHTHFTTKFDKCGLIVLSNQRGYFLHGTNDEKRAERSGNGGFDVRCVIPHPS